MKPAQDTPPWALLFALTRMRFFARLFFHPDRVGGWLLAALGGGFAAVALAQTPAAVPAASPSPTQTAEAYNVLWQARYAAAWARWREHKGLAAENRAEPDATGVPGGPTPPAPSPAQQADIEQFLSDGGDPNNLEAALISAAVHTDHPAAVEAVLAGGDVRGLEIKPPPTLKTKAVALRPVRVFDAGDIPPSPWSRGRGIGTVEGFACVIRRMTTDRFELWTARRGWLFDAGGRLLNEARVPRRDGTGREWHGAFLPDGRWVTTDLWEMDKTLTFFSRRGKWLREIPAAKVAPRLEEWPWDLDLIGWARCNKEGTGWLVSGGDAGGRALAFVKPNGAFRWLMKTVPADEAKDGGRFRSEGEPFAPWRLCHPRDVEPKGMWTCLSIPSDDRRAQLSLTAPSHGIWCGYPDYTWSSIKNKGGGERPICAGDGLTERVSTATEAVEAWSQVIPHGNHNFGFLPGSHHVFIGAEAEEEVEGNGGNGDNASGASNDGNATRWFSKTWFFASDGKNRGWLRAAYLGDAASGEGRRTATWYVEENGGVLELAERRGTLQVLARRRFTLNGKTAHPIKLFADLRLGFFKVELPAKAAKPGDAGQRQDSDAAADAAENPASGEEETRLFGVALARW